MNNYQNGIGFNGSWPAPVPNEFANLIQKIAPPKEQTAVVKEEKKYNTFAAFENN